MAVSHRPRRNHPQPPSYRDESSTDEDDALPSRRSQRLNQSIKQLSLGGNSSRVQPVRASDTGLIVAKQKRAPPTKAKQQSGFESFKRRKLTQNETKKISKSSLKIQTSIKSSRIPVWQSLDYLHLVRILKYAAYPLFSDASTETGSITWLLGASTLSRSFHEAAIAVLLFSPPVFPATRAHSLQARLNEAQDSLMVPYDNKIKRLDIEVKHLLIKKSGIDLLKLIAKTPLLEALNIYHNHDQVGPVSWAQPSAESGKSYTYPDNLFDALDNNNIRLKEWAWNGRFPNTKAVLPQMASMHQKKCLERLECLSILNLSVPVKDADKIEMAASLQTGLIVLKRVHELRVESCSLFYGSVIVSLPFELRRLSIVNCQNVDSAHLQSYLARNGSKLQHLSLKGNQALDLGFAHYLKGCCPRLQVFEMNFTYYDTSFFNDVSPHYEEVFPDGDMPRWPLSLQRLSFENLRNLDADEAGKFLESLVSAAPDLKDLRSIYLRILLHEEGWRERAKFRQKWEPKLEDVFLRKAPPPQTFSRLPDSAFALRTMTSRPSTSHSVTSGSFSTDDSAAPPNKRKSTRLAEREAENIESTKEQWRTQALAALSPAPANNTPDEDDGLQRQRMCYQVELHVDGQRPAAEQFVEADFLTEELEGDSAYTG